MARLHEHQGKELLKGAGIAVPDGIVCRSPREVLHAVSAFNDESVVLKAQAWVTSRAARGGVRFADSPDEAVAHAEEMFDLRFGAFPVEEILVERVIEIAREIFISFSIDDAAKAPVLLIDCSGGSGIEDRAATVSRVPVDIERGPDPAAVRDAFAGSGIDTSLHDGLMRTVGSLFDLAKSNDARSLEVNPLVITSSGEIVAADCRITIDDYAVFRHPELGIEIARELDHPPTDLERLAYRIEESDHRGTFYFAQLATEAGEDSRGLIGFHGAGGGGSMMSMDAVTNAGFTLANFCDTSGNPSASKVYWAARIILNQPDIIGYFGSGSGVASQEQFWSAYGLAKAFNEFKLAIPAVIRLGGNSEDRAVEILEDTCRGLPGRVEGYKKDDTPAFCAQRFAALVEEVGGVPERMKRHVPEFVGRDDAYNFPINGGRVWIDHDQCSEETSRLAIGHSAGLLKPDRTGRPVLAVSTEEIAAKDSELIACEIECLRAGRPVVFIDLHAPEPSA